MKSYRKFIIFILLINIFSGTVSISAQTRKTPAKKASTPAKQPTGQGGDNQYKTCNGGWSGIVTYKKILRYSKDFGVQKQVGKGTTHNKLSHDYTYTGRVVVDGSKGVNILKAKGQVSLRDIRKDWRLTEQKDTCFYDGKKEAVRQWTEKEESDMTNAFGEGDAGFSMRVNQFDGTYYFSFSLPQADGTNDREYKKTAGGWCSAKFNEPEARTTKDPVKINGGGTQIEAKIDPNRPDVLSGSKTWEEDTEQDYLKYVYTVSWSFKRCPAPVEVTDVRFDEHPVGNVNEWKEIEDGTDTIDGNIVRIRATVTNFSGETKFPAVKFSELVENWILPDGEKNLRLEAGESREIELEWDTSGYAWKGKGWDAESNRRIKVEALDENRTSQLTKTVIVSPRPVILVHGLWSNAAAWTGYDKFFEEGHSAYWKSYAVGADPNVAKMNTGERFGNTTQTYRISWNARELDKQIDFVRKDLNAWHVDIVAHSMGGLISRYYIADLMPNNPLGRKPVVTRLLMLGTPNQGSPCANLMYAAYSAKGHKIWALWELRPAFLEGFNQRFRDRRGVRFSALAGKAIPATCQTPLRGDGVVSIGSARWMVKDWKYSNSLAHTDLTSRTDFGTFVFPRLSIGPRGNHDPEIPTAGIYPQQDKSFADAGDSLERPNERYGLNSYFQKASFKHGNNKKDDGEEMGDVRIEGLAFAEQIELKANQTAEIAIPVSGGSRASVVFVAPANVSATLFDETGNIIGKSSADTADARQMFRTITVEKLFKKGVWKLKLENRSALETNVFTAAFTDQNPLAFSVSAGKPNAAGQIYLQAKLTDNGLPVKDAKITALLNDVNEIAFYDDGKNGDGAAGDGIYGAKLEKLGDGDYLIEARAETNAQTLFTAETLIIGNETKTADIKRPKN